MFRPCHSILRVKSFLNQCSRFSDVRCLIGSWLEPCEHRIAVPMSYVTFVEAKMSLCSDNRLPESAFPTQPFVKAGKGYLTEALKEIFKATLKGTLKGTERNF